MSNTNKKEFESEHLYFGSIRRFDEDDPPKWMLTDEYQWWYDKHVLALEVGQSISTDFHKITRIA